MNNLKDRDLDAIVHAYLVCALWASTAEDGTPVDDLADTDDVNAEARQSARDDCEDFLKLCDREGVSLKDWDDAQIGHDFWLTRNHHGAGFWDRGRGEVGERATKLAHTFSERDVFVGDDGAVYIE